MQAGLCAGDGDTRFRVDQDIVAIRLHSEAIQSDCRIVIVFTGAAVVGPLVPGSNHQVVLDVSLPDGSASVRADSRKRVQFAV